MRVSILVLTICLALGSLLAQNSPSDISIVGPQATLTPFEQTVAKAEKAFLNAADRGDVQYVENALAQDFYSIGSNGDADLRSDFIEGVRSAKPAGAQKPGEREMLYFFKLVPLNENAAMVSYDVVRPGDHPRYVHISHAWAQQDGQWKLKFQQETPKIWSAADID